MEKIRVVVLALVILLTASVAGAKSIGKFRKYHQVTDKEVLLETNKGAKVLVTAYNNYALGIRFISDSEKVALLSPSAIQNEKKLSGSIYVEELDELMQITTTNPDGVVIKIEKNPLRLSYINKKTGEAILSELSGGNFSDKGHEIIFKSNEGETLSLLSSDDLFTLTKPIAIDIPLMASDITSTVKQNNEICIESSEGYALVLPKEATQSIELNKKKGLIVKNKEQSQMSYMLIYGPEKPELIEKYAFNINEKENQISQK